MTRLINSDVTDMLNQVNQYKKTVQDAFYQHYKNIFVLTKTNNFRGQGADAYKEYLARVTINYIIAFINISEDVSTALKKISSNYNLLESSGKGSIDSDILKDVRANLSNRNQGFQSLAAEISSLNNEASSYISVKRLNTSEIIGEYSRIDRELYNVGDKLTEIDSISLAEVNNLMDRINKLTYQLKTIANDYHEDNKISADKVEGITTQNWYKVECADNLSAMTKEDPFFYNLDAKYFSEGQWARGIATDTYIYTGYSIFGGAYNVSRNNGVLSGDVTASAFNAYENLQVTDYLKQNANISLGTLSASGKLGLAKDLAGAQVKGSYATVDANASVVLGTDKFNCYLKTNATALSAGGYANLYYKPSNGDLGIGLGGKATGASASFTLGTSLLSVPGNTVKNDYAGGMVKVTSSTSLLGAGVTVKAGASFAADFDVSSTRAIDWGEVNVNAVHVKLGGQLGLGADVDITIPILTIDMPWED